MTIDIARLEKLYALTESDHAGEAHNALAATKALLKKHGKTMRDIPELLGSGKASGTLGLGDQDYWQIMAAGERGLRWAAERERDSLRQALRAAHEKQAKLDAAAAAEKAQRDRVAAANAKREAKEDAKERKAVIARYGSLKAAIAPCQREALLRTAVKQWSSYVGNVGRDGRWTSSIEKKGWGDCRGCLLSPHVERAIKTAYPMPITLKEAYAEVAYWQRRSREIELISPEGHCLDMPAFLRYELVATALIHEIEPTSFADLAWRQRFMIDAEKNDLWTDTNLELLFADQMADTILKDIERLSAVPVRETVVSHHQFRAARQSREPPVVAAKQQHGKTKKANAAQTDFGF